MSGVFTGGIVGGLLHFGWSLSRWVLCWVMHARNRVNDMLVLIVLRGQAEGRRSNMQACCDKEREREPPWLVFDSSSNRRTCHQVCLSAPLSSSPRARHPRFHVPIYLIYIYAFSCNIHVTTIEPWARRSNYSMMHNMVTQQEQAIAEISFD